ncbi:MAG: nucleoside 2-deoxyribosyltransferase [Shimia sp.]|uniref:nucleoside 2-deoxyribosyltransferase n=1 Tax=Shimia sp. TaxID=1954381 RepID=UPI0040586D84
MSQTLTYFRPHLDPKTLPTHSRDIQRDLKLPMELVRSLGGVSLPWHERAAFNIYLAAPDFSYIDKHEMDEAVSALEYHNFNVRRPIQENGKVARPADIHTLREVYNKDIALLEECDVFLLCRWRRILAHWSKSAMP